MKKKKQNHNTKPNQTTFWTQVSMNYQRWYEKVRHVATGFIWKHFHMSENATYWKKCLSNSMQTCNSKQKLLYKIVSLLCCVFLTCMHFFWNSAWGQVGGSSKNVVLQAFSWCRIQTSSLRESKSTSCLNATMPGSGRQLSLEGGVQSTLRFPRPGLHLSFVSREDTIDRYRQSTSEKCGTRRYYYSHQKLKIPFLTDSIADKSVFPLVPHEASTWFLLCIFICVWVQVTALQLLINPQMAGKPSHRWPTPKAASVYRTSASVLTKN